jgi:hypothetical protein
MEPLEKHHPTTRSWRLTQLEETLIEVLQAR